MPFGGGGGGSINTNNTPQNMYLLINDTEQMIYVSIDILTEMLDKVDVKLMLSKKQFHHLNLITFL